MLKYFPFLIVFLIGCSQAPPEEAVSERVEEIQQAVQDKDLGDVLDYIAEDFKGNDIVDKETVKRILLAHYLKHNKLNAYITSLTVEESLSAERGVTMDAVVVVTAGPNILPEDGRIIHFQGFWQAVDGKDDWKLVELTWR